MIEFCSDSLLTIHRHLACEEERVEVCKILIRAGARIDSLNKEKRSPLDLLPHESVKKTLLDVGKESV